MNKQSLVQPNPCMGKNCHSTDGTGHSLDCLFEHFAAYSGLEKETSYFQNKIREAFFEGFAAGVLTTQEKAQEGK